MLQSTCALDNTIHISCKKKIKEKTKAFLLVHIEISR